jgi:hypothetical protein
MPSPFPGMNPYLERPFEWDSFHPNFIVACLYHLVRQVSPKYIVQIETRLYFHEPPADRRYFGNADVNVTSSKSSAIQTAAVAEINAPTYVALGEQIEVEKVHYLVIRDRHGNEVVTTLELLSRSNKYSSEDREQYLFKRMEVLRSNSHFVEIDLLRGGPRMPPEEIPPCDYYALVSLAGERRRSGVWPWRLREPMPTIPIPLRAPDPNASLDMKAIIDSIYDQSGLEYHLYNGPPEPRLSPDDAAWAAQFLPAPPS